MVETVDVESLLDLWGCEQTILCRDDALGLRAVIAIDHTGRGPGLGGVRMQHYPTHEAGVRECQRLAAAMSRKHALAGTPFGGAKAVVFSDGPVDDRIALMRRFGEFVAATGGRYIPGVDMGTSVDDLALIGASGAEVSCSATDPSDATALGVWAAIRATVRHVDDRGDIEAIRVVVQGAGHVGAELVRLLAIDGASVAVCDADPARAAALAEHFERVEAIDPAGALETPCDVFAPCAIAGVLHADSIPRLRCRIVAGAANDTLAHLGADRLLLEHGVTYVPDYIANAGGVIQIHAEREGWDDERLAAQVMTIGDRVIDVLAEADERAETPLFVAEARAAKLLDRRA